LRAPVPVQLLGQLKGPVNISHVPTLESNQDRTGQQRRGRMGGPIPAGRLLLTGPGAAGCARGREERAAELARRAARDPQLARKAVASLRTEIGPPQLPWAAAL